MRCFFSIFNFVATVAYESFFSLCSRNPSQRTRIEQELLATYKREKPKTTVTPIVEMAFTEQENCFSVI